MDTNTYMIELHDDTLNDIMRQELARHLEWFKSDIKARKKGKGLAYFDIDPKKDVKEIQKHADAFKLVLKYYGGAKS